MDNEPIEPIHESAQSALPDAKPMSEADYSQPTDRATAPMDPHSFSEGARHEYGTPCFRPYSDDYPNPFLP